MERKLLTVAQAAEAACVSPSLVYEWVAEGRLAALRLGRGGRPGCIRIAPGDLDGFLAACRVGRPAEAAPPPPGLKVDLW